VPIAAAHHAGTVLAVKVVPGASRERVVGPLGERLKLTVRKPPEKGAANGAACQLLARALGVKAADIAVIRGEARPEKEILVRGLRPADVLQRLGMA